MKGRQPLSKPIRSLSARLLKASLLLSLGSTLLITAASAAQSSAPPLSREAAQNTNNLSDQAAEKISLNFSNIKTRELLQIIAQFTKMNFVISDNVQGSMSIHLKNVPWTRALHIILKSQGLGQIRMGNVVLVDPLKELESREVAELQAKERIRTLQTTRKILDLQNEKKIAELSPLKNEVISLHYADAEALSKMLKEGSLLSERGKVNFDARTNAVWVQDTDKRLKTVTAFVKKLDHPEKQVLIESRIVKIEQPFERELGARLGVSSGQHLSGTYTGASSLASGTAIADVTPADRLNFNLPANSILGNAAGTIGLAVAKLGGTTRLDLELSALEREGEVQVISTPRLITSNKKAAYIQKGQEIPYQASTSSGATSVEYKDAVLSLRVTPQIVSKGQVILNIKVSKNSAGTPVVLSGGGESIPIDTEEEESNVLLNNKQTVVLGGVYEQTKQKIKTGIPYLSKIPILGKLLFTHTNDTDNHTEILFFLTPVILDNPNDLHEQWDVDERRWKMDQTPYPYGGSATEMQKQRMIANKSKGAWSSPDFVDKQELNEYTPAPPQTNTQTSVRPPESSYLPSPERTDPGVGS